MSATLLGKLDAIDWATVEDAYGPATALPGHLRALLDAKAPARRKALEAIVDAINHQTSVTPAALDAAPFLVELASSDAVKDRGRILALLADLAVGGNHVSFLTTGFDPQKHPAPADHPYKRLHTMVAAGGDAYRRALGVRDAGTRAGAAMVLGYLGEQAEVSCEALRRALEGERDAVAKASILVALALLDRAAGSRGDRARFESAIAAEEPVERLAGAIALALAHGEDASEAAIEAVIAAVSAPPEPARNLPWCWGEPDNLAALAAAEIAARRKDGSICDRLLAATDGKPAQPSVAGRLLDAVFGPGKGDALRVPSLLSGAERGLLAAITKRGLHRRVRHALETRGVPMWNAERVAGLQAPGALDREVVGEPLWKTLSDVIHDRAEERAWWQAIAGVPPAELLACCDEAATSSPVHLPCPSPLELNSPAVWQRENRLVRLLVATLLERVPKQALAAAYDQPFTPEPGRRWPRRAAVRALVLSALADQAPLAPQHDTLLSEGLGDACAELLRGLLARLPLGRREAVLERASFQYYGQGPGKQEVRGAWLYADVCPTARMAERVVAELRKWGPIFHPSERALAHAVEVLVAIGEPARPLLEAELAGGPSSARDVAEAALHRLAR